MQAEENDQIVAEEVKEEQVENNNNNEEESSEKAEGAEGEGAEGEEGVVKKKKKRYCSDDEEGEERITVVYKIPPNRPLPPPPPKVYDVDKSVWATTSISQRVWDVDEEDVYEEPTEPVIDYGAIFSETDFAKKYEFGEEIGLGVFSTVFAVYKKDNKQKFAGKIMDLPGAEILQRAEISDFDVLSKLEHKNIIKAIDFFKTETHSLTILESFCGADFSKNPKPYSEDDIRTIGYQIIDAIAYLHERKIAHGDISPENALINDNKEVKLCGFSCSREITSEKNETRQLIGNIEFQSPEILMRQGYHLSTDIWSFGCLLFFLLFGESPFYHKNSIQMQSRIRSAVLELGDRNMSADMQKMITSLLQKSAEARPTAAAVKADPFWKK